MENLGSNLFTRPDPESSYARLPDRPTPQSADQPSLIYNISISSMCPETLKTCCQQKKNATWYILVINNRIYS